MRNGERMEPSASGPTRVPVTVSVAWRSKRVTTDPPRHAEHLEWQVAFTLAAPRPIRVVALLTHGAETHWGLQPDEPATECALRAMFAPWTWRSSDAVGISFGFRRTRVTDAALKQDARDVATITAPERTETGAVTSVLELPGHAITLAFIALAQEDTEVRRLHRWRVKPAIAESLPAALAPLASGYQTGTLIAGDD
jgi:hypothetical protein